MVTNWKYQVRIMILTVVMLCLATPIPSHAAWKLVIDPYCVIQWGKNMTTVEAMEQAHNAELKEVKKEQDKIAEYTATMAVIKEAYKETMANIKGFGTESKYYVEIGTTAYEIITRIPKLVKTISNSKFEGKVACITELTNIASRTQQLVADFVNIVNNAKVENPLKGNATTKKKGDGYNFLSRYDRLNVAIRIYTDLNSINYKLEYMEYLAQYTTWNSLFFKVDPKGWANIVGGKLIAESIINDWKRL